ncbi:MAG: carbon-nitrogen hydrolase [Gammaproteobacteria bacterium]|nr:carbon-nitrogen hydrolase [Gammaproteobacteria bacterium]
MKAGLIQHSNIEDTHKNLHYTLEKIDLLAQQGAQLIVLQELHSSLYFCQTESQHHFDLAESLDGNTASILATCAKKNKVVIIGSIFEKRSNGVYHNTAIVLDNDGSFAGHYRKMHIPDDPGYYEKYYFTPGDTGFTPIKTNIGTLGILICWDQWFPESARLMALAGAEILIFPTAIGWDTNDTKEEKQRQLDAWITIQRSHSIANNLPVISVNRVGYEKDPSKQTDGIQFWGNSFACDARGKIIAACSSEKNENVIIDIDLTESDQQRLVWPYFRDRRIDAYIDLTKRSID